MVVGHSFRNPCSGIVKLDCDHLWGSFFQRIGFWMMIEVNLVPVPISVAEQISKGTKMNLAKNHIHVLENQLTSKDVVAGTSRSLVSL
jgi:hypothetical protein